MTGNDTFKGVAIILLKRCSWFLVLVVGGMCLFACGKEATLFKKEKVIAKVDGARITNRDLVRYYRSVVPTIPGDPGQKDPVTQDLKKSLLERLIDDKLLLIQAAKSGITVSDEEVQKLYEGIARDYGKDFKTYLKSLHLTPEAWKKALREDLLIDKVIKRHMRTIQDVTRKEIETYYNAHRDEFQIPMEYHIAQIVVPSRKLAEQVMEELKKGKEFQKLAKRFSIFPEGKRGGDLGFWREDRLPEEFEMVRQMRVGEVSGILHSPYGYHIIKLEGLKESRILSLKEAGPRIAEKLRREMREKEKARWLEELKKKAHIVRDMKALEDVSFN